MARSCAVEWAWVIYLSGRRVGTALDDSHVGILCKALTDFPEQCTEGREAGGNLEGVCSSDTVGLYQGIARDSMTHVDEQGNNPVFTESR